MGTGVRKSPSGLALNNGFKLRGVILDELACYVEAFIVWNPNKSVNGVKGADVNISPKDIGKITPSGDYLDEYGRLNPQNIRAFTRKNGFADMKICVVVARDPATNKPIKIRRLVGQAIITERWRRNKRGEGDLFYKIRVPVADSKTGEPLVKNGRKVALSLEITADAGYSFPLEFKDVSIKHVDVASVNGKTISNYHIAGKKNSNVDTGKNADSNGDIKNVEMDADTFAQLETLIKEHGINTLSSKEKKKALELDSDLFDMDIFAGDDDTEDSELNGVTGSTTETTVETSITETVEEPDVEVNETDYSEDNALSAAYEPDYEPDYDMDLGATAEDNAPIAGGLLACMTDIGVNKQGADLSGAAFGIPVQLSTLTMVDKDSDNIQKAWKLWEELNQKLDVVCEGIKNGKEYSYHGATITEDNSKPHAAASGGDDLIEEVVSERRVYPVFGRNGINIQIGRSFVMKSLTSAEKLPIITSCDSKARTIYRICGDYEYGKGFGYDDGTTKLTSSEVFETMSKISALLGGITPSTLYMGVKVAGEEATFATYSMEVANKKYNQGKKDGTIQSSASIATNRYLEAIKKFSGNPIEKTFFDTLVDPETGKLIEPETEKKPSKPKSDMDFVFSISDDARCEEAEATPAKARTGVNKVCSDAYRNFMFWLLGTLKAKDSSLEGFDIREDTWAVVSDTNGKGVYNTRKFSLTKEVNPQEVVAGSMTIKLPLKVKPGGEPV